MYQEKFFSSKDGDIQKKIALGGNAIYVTDIGVGFFLFVCFSGRIGNHLLKNDTSIVDTTS